MMSCPCGSSNTYDDCCGPYINGAKNPPTAEALMRSRYTAYVKKEIDYIVQTCTGNEKDKVDVQQTRNWSERSRWLGLKILAVEKGGPNDAEGIVEFEASYEMDGLKEVHHERGTFKKKDNKWFYDEGDIKPKTVVRARPKLGRNEPCFCGSGKKYKHCCAQ